VSELESIGTTLNRLTKVLQRMADAPVTQPKREWYPANLDTAKLLGYDTYQQLWEAIDSGLLRVGKGKEVADRRKPNTQRPVYYVHLQRALERLEIEPEKRAS